MARAYLGLYAALLSGTGTYAEETACAS
jgi:hypothetical protein